MTAYRKPYRRTEEYWCKVCGNEWHDMHDDCWAECKGCTNYVKKKKTNYYFDETDHEGYYCDECFEIKMDEIEHETIPVVKEPEEFYLRESKTSL